MAKSNEKIPFPKIKITSEKEAIAAVREDGGNLQFVPKKYMTAELCLIAVKKTGYTLEHEQIFMPQLVLAYVPEKFRTPKLCMAAVMQEPFALLAVPEKFKTLELCIAAVQADRRTLKHIPDTLKSKVKTALKKSIV